MLMGRFYASLPLFPLGGDGYDDVFYCSIKDFPVCDVVNFVSPWAG